MFDEIVEKSDIMFAIYKKELRSYFINAIGYVYVGVFLALSALLCCYSTLIAKTYDTSGYFTFLIVSFIILIPLLTMKLFAEEKKLRTEQLLLTAPVSLWGMVIGKFLAAFTLFAGTVVASCVSFFPLYAYANEERLAFAEAYGEALAKETDIGPMTAVILSCLLGVLMIGMVFISIGLFISSLTENQLAAAVLTVAVILMMLLCDLVVEYIPVPAIQFVIGWFGIMSRYKYFTAGMLDFAAILYYLSISGVFLLLTVRVYDKRRWG